MFWNRKKSIEDIEREMIEQSGIHMNDYEDHTTSFQVDGKTYTMQIFKNSISIYTHHPLSFPDDAEKCKLYTNNLGMIMEKLRDVARNTKESTREHTNKCIQNLWDKLIEMR